MAELNPLISVEDLRDYLSPTILLRIFDDDNTGDLDTVMASRPVQLVLTQAHANCVSWLPVMYNTLPDGDDAELPELLRGAELEYAKALAWDRHREIAKASSVDVDALYKRVDLKMTRLQESTLRIADSPPEAKPRNVGGLVRDEGFRVMCGTTSGVSNSGDF